MRAYVNERSIDRQIALMRIVVREDLSLAMAERLVREDGLAAYDAQIMTQSRPFAAYYEAVRAASGAPKLAANWLMGEVSKRLNAESLTVEQAPLAPAVQAVWL